MNRTLASTLSPTALAPNKRVCNFWKTQVKAVTSPLQLLKVPGGISSLQVCLAAVKFCCLMQPSYYFRDLLGNLLVTSVCIALGGFTLHFIFMDMAFFRLHEPISTAYKLFFCSFLFSQPSRTEESQEIALDQAFGLRECCGTV